VVVWVGATVCDPDVAVDAVQFAEQLVALVEVQERADVCPEVIDVGLAVRVTEGRVGDGIEETLIR